MMYIFFDSVLLVCTIDALIPGVVSDSLEGKEEEGEGKNINVNILTLTSIFPHLSDVRYMYVSEKGKGEEGGGKQ